MGMLTGFSLPMKQLLSLLLALLVAAGLLVACGGDAVPPLAESGQPTLVFIYTEA